MFLIDFIALELSLTFLSAYKSFKKQKVFK